MRRWSVIAFMLLVLPFQLVWAAAAPVCAHETQVAAKKHFGHHEHQHQGAGSDSAAADEGGIDGSKGSGTYHADCETCHLGTSVAVTSPTPVVTPLPHGAVHGDHRSTYRSHIPSGLERPDRLELTAAARFGGGVEFSLHPA